jgi:hypothetical protein
MRRTKMKRIRFPQLSFEESNQIAALTCLVAILTMFAMVWSLGYYTGSVDTMVKYESIKIVNTAK